MTLRNDQIAIVNGVSSNQQVLADVTFPNHAKYAARHGYVMLTREIDPRERVWGKVRILQQIFADPNIRRALWIDADAIFTNPELSLTEHLPDGKVVMVCDRFGPNTGVMWMENCPEVRRLLWAITRRGVVLFANRTWHEQAALRYFYYRPPYRELFTFVSQSKMNAYLGENHLDNTKHFVGKRERWPEDGLVPWKPGDFILHLPGLPHEFRIKVLKGVLSQCPS